MVSIVRVPFKDVVLDSHFKFDCVAILEFAKIVFPLAKPSVL